MYAPQNRTSPYGAETAMTRHRSNAQCGKALQKFGKRRRCTRKRSRDGATPTTNGEGAPPHLRALGDVGIRRIGGGTVQAQQILQREDGHHSGLERRDHHVELFKHIAQTPALQVSGERRAGAARSKRGSSSDGPTAPPLPRARQGSHKLWARSGSTAVQRLGVAPTLVRAPAQLRDARVCRIRDIMSDQRSQILSVSDAV